MEIKIIPRLLNSSLKVVHSGSLLVALVVRIPGFHCHGPDSILGQGTEIP